MIRLADFNDIPALHDLSYLWDEDGEPIDEDVLSNYITDGTVYCAEEGDEIAGIMILIENGDRSIQLSRLFVHPYYRQCGIGNQFIEQLKTHMDQASLQTAFVTVSLQNDDALLLYEQRGFCDTGSRHQGRYGETYCDMALNVPT